MRRSDELSAVQEKFVRDLHFGGTIRGAFQRAGLYGKGANDKRKRAFTEDLRKALERAERPYWARRVGSKAHVANIERLIGWSKAYAATLKGGSLNFGVAQKLLNLHLKGLWCFGLLPHAPPHLPVDRIIQERLRIRPIRAWTRIGTAEVYLEVIEAADRIAKEHGISLAELELRAFNGTFELPKRSRTRT